MLLRLVLNVHHALIFLATIVLHQYIKTILLLSSKVSNGQWSQLRCKPHPAVAKEDPFKRCPSEIFPKLRKQFLGKHF